MAYTPTVWVTGDTITAEKLNKAEQGIAGASPVVLTGEWEEGDGSYGIFFCTLDEFNEMILSGRNILFDIPELENKLNACVLRFKDFDTDSGTPMQPLTYFGTVTLEDPDHSSFMLIVSGGTAVIAVLTVSPA